MCSNVPIDDPPFWSSNFFLSQTRANLADFEVNCQRFAAECTYEVVCGDDSRTDEKVVSLRFSNRVTPELRKAAHVILTDIKSALDQAVCAAQRELGGGKSDKLVMPFADSAHDFEGRLNNPKSIFYGLHPAIKDAVRAIQPYSGGNDLLYELSKRANKSKHVNLTPSALGANDYVLRAEDIGVIRTPVKFPIWRWDRRHNEMEFARIGPGGYMNMNIRQAVHVVLGEGHPPLNRPAPTVLREFLKSAESFVTQLELLVNRLTQGPSL